MSSSVLCAIDLAHPEAAHDPMHPAHVVGRHARRLADLRQHARERLSARPS